MLDWSPLFLSLKLATATTLLLLLVGIPLAHWLAFSKSKVRLLFEAVVTLPLVLPPTVLGFYLLLAFSPSGTFGAFIERVFGMRLVFSYTGLLVASAIYSLPFMVQPLQSALKALPGGLREASATMGKSRIETLVRVLLPNIRPGLITGCVLAFAHTLGEFGVVLMIGGNIPGKTRVASIAIFDEVESLNYSEAHLYSAVLLLVSFLILVLVYFLNHRNTRIGPG